MPCHISLTNSNPDMRRKLQQSELIMPIECSHLCAALSADMRTRKHRDNCSTWSNSSGCEHFGAGNVHSRCSQTWLVSIERDRTKCKYWNEIPVNATIFALQRYTAAIKGACPSNIPRTCKGNFKDIWVRCYCVQYNNHTLYLLQYLGLIKVLLCAI